MLKKKIEGGVDNCQLGRRNKVGEILFCFKIKIQKL
jgi:hypothetical protein